MYSVTLDTQVLAMDPLQLVDVDYRTPFMNTL